MRRGAKRVSYIRQALLLLLAIGLIGLPTTSAHAGPRGCSSLCPNGSQWTFPSTEVGATSTLTVTFISNPAYAGELLQIPFYPGLDTGATTQGISIDVADSTCFTLAVWPAGGVGCTVVLTWTPLRAGGMTTASLYLGATILYTLDENGDFISMNGINSYPAFLSGLATAPPDPAPPAPIVPIPVPDPVQQSSVTSVTPRVASSDTSTSITVTGNFIELISNIQVNDLNIAQGSWLQTPTAITFTLAKTSATSIDVVIYNGAAPVLTLDPISVTSAPKAVMTTVKQKVTYLFCSKPGHGIRVVYGYTPACPSNS